MQYSFRRNFYEQVKASLKEYPVTVLLGPLRCGKTVCLKQLNEDLENVRYFDFKILSEDETLSVLDEVLEALQKNAEIIFLLDDVSYVKNIETELWKIADVCHKRDSNTRIVLAGSLLYAVETWVNRAFHGPIGKIRAGFLSYSEYIRYKNLPEESAETYEQYLQEVALFHQIGSLNEYLEECLEETRIANGNTSDYLLENDCYLVEGHIEYLVQVYLQTVGKEVSNEMPLESNVRKQALQLLKNWGLNGEDCECVIF